MCNKITNLPPGKYYHFGLKPKLLMKLIQNNFKGDEVNISININGLPLTKSNNHGENKPNNNIFLQKFIEEMKFLQ